MRINRRQGRNVIIVTLRRRHLISQSSCRIKFCLRYPSCYDTGQQLVNTGVALFVQCPWTPAVVIQTQTIPVPQTSPANFKTRPKSCLNPTTTHKLGGDYLETRHFLFQRSFLSLLPCLLAKEKRKAYERKLDTQHGRLEGILKDEAHVYVCTCTHTHINSRPE